MATETIYDVAIIGGGLAGLSLALQLAGQHYKVALHEKEDYPFHKVCGEYISLESWDFLLNLGVDLESLQLPIIKKLTLSDVRGRMYGFDLPMGGFGVSRFTLDNLLYKLAVAKGVDVFTNSKVTGVDFRDDCFVVSSKNQLKAKVVSASYGKRSNLDIKWKRTFTNKKEGGLKNFVGVKYHVRYNTDSEKISLHNFSGGYCGLSKIEDDKSCLCYLTTAQNLNRSGNSIAEMERNIVFKNPALKEIFQDATFLYSEPLAISQISFDKKKQVENHVLMLGDAAGMISPLCGNGMSMAMHSSKIAFTAIQDFLVGKISRIQMENTYTAKWKNNFSKRIWVGRNVQKFFGGNLTTSLFLQTMRAIPPFSRLLIKATHGKPF